jgi:SnoaL-like domain
MMRRPLDLHRRQLIAGVVGGMAAISIVDSAGATQPLSGSDPRATFPRQGWVHKDGVAAMKSPSTTQAVASPMDYLLIHEAYARYGMAHDELQFHVLDDLFTENAELRIAKGEGRPFQIVTGRKQIIGNFANVLRQQQDQRRHCFTNILIDKLEETAATTLAYGIVTVAANGLILGATVFYRGELSKIAGNWRFSRMFIGMDDYTTPAPKV